MTMLSIERSKSFNVIQRLNKENNFVSPLKMNKKYVLTMTLTLLPSGKYDFLNAKPCFTYDLSDGFSTKIQKKPSQWYLWEFTPTTS